MPHISVRTKPGRVARTSPRGQYIPTDRFMIVEDTPYIRRLLDVHGDIELEPKKEKAKAMPAPSPEVPATPAADKK